MRIENCIYLSHILNSHTPTYGNRNTFEQVKKSDISKGDVANDTSISTTVHIGTHIDMPYHFYEEGQTIENYDASFWHFKKVLFVDILPKNLLIHTEVLDVLADVKDQGYELLIVKTGICHRRNTKEFWHENYGFHADIYDYLIQNFPSLRVLGFDSISVSSIQDRMMGREAHKRFLNPEKPILLLEDMDLTGLCATTQLKEVLISPLRIEKCDGLPCTVFGSVDG